MQAKRIIDKYYGSESRLREILTRHSMQVSAMALEIAAVRRLDLAPEIIAEAAMLHDIGIYRTHAPSIMCMGDKPYICHGIIGAEILRGEGVDESICRVAERHTGAGITQKDIDEQHLPLPAGDYLPETLLERLICYADKFYSKSGEMQRKPLERVKASMQKFGDDTYARFMALHEEFGEVDHSSAGMMM